MEPLLGAHDKKKHAHNNSLVEGKKKKEKDFLSFFIFTFENFGANKFRVGPNAISTLLVSLLLSVCFFSSSSSFFLLLHLSEAALSKAS